MARKVKHSELDSRSSRARLKAKGREPHWQSLVSGERRAHLGWQAWKGSPGRWVLRRSLGDDKYQTIPLGRADDKDLTADGRVILSYEQAKAKALAMIEAAGDQRGSRLTVRRAMDRYIEFKRGQGANVSDLIGRTRVHILPVLGDLAVSELTAERLRRWVTGMAAQPAQSRPRGDKPVFKPEPVTDEAIRSRRASANRVLTILKAALNFAFDEGLVSNRDAWGRKLKPFRDVETARARYLSVDEAQRLINASDPALRPLVVAALQTGARYGELVRLEAHDFNADAGTIAIRRSKSGKPRHIVLTDEGSEFFRAHCAGRAKSELMFSHEDGEAWKKSEQSRPMREACAAAKIVPALGIHGLRHTWASLSVMAGMPLLVVARNLGHADTRMVEKHYGHLAPSFIADAIRAAAPRFGVKTPKTVVPLKRR
jgi:integrase